MVLYHFDQSQPQTAPPVPAELVPLMKQLAKQVLKQKPDNIHEFAAEFFENLLIQRDGSLDKGYGKFRSYRTYCEFMQQMDEKETKVKASAWRSTRPGLVDGTDSGVASGASRSCQENPGSVASDGDIAQPDESVRQMAVCGVGIAASSRPTRNVAVKVRNAKSISVQSDSATVSFSEEVPSSKPKVKPRKLSSKKPADDLIVITEETSTDVADLMGGTAIQVIAARRIQKAFREFRGRQRREQRREQASSEALGGTAIQVIAARRIQNAYRAFMQKRRLTEDSKRSAHHILEGTAVQVIAARRIQRAFRAFTLRKENAAKSKEMEMLGSTASQVIAAKRIQREYRAYKQRNAHSNENKVKAEREVIEYTADEEIAAGRIQKIYRAFSIRKVQEKEQSLLANQIHAARTIQRALRKFLANVRARNMISKVATAIVVDTADSELLIPQTNKDVHVASTTEKSLAELLVQTQSKSQDEDIAKRNALQIIDDLLKKEEFDAGRTFELEDTNELNDSVKDPNGDLKLIERESSSQINDVIIIRDSDSISINKLEGVIDINSSQIAEIVSEHINEQTDLILENDILSSNTISSEYHGQIEVTEEPCVERIVKRVIGDENLDDNTDKIEANVDDNRQIEFKNEDNAIAKTEIPDEKQDDTTRQKNNFNEKVDGLPTIEINEDDHTNVLKSGDKDQSNVQHVSIVETQDSTTEDLIDPTQNDLFLSIQDDFDLSEHSNTSTVIEVNKRETDTPDTMDTPDKTSNLSENDPFGHVIEPASSLTPTKPAYFADRRHTIATIAEDLTEHLQELHDAADPDRAILKSLPEEIPYEPLLSSGEHSDSTVATDDVTIESSTEESSSNSQPEDEGSSTNAKEMEDIDLSNYDEDSLEAMYYSLRKNEIELDRMQSKKNAIKSKSVDCKATNKVDDNLSIALDDYGRTESDSENSTQFMSETNNHDIPNDSNDVKHDETEDRDKSENLIISSNNGVDPLKEEITESNIHVPDSSSIHDVSTIEDEFGQTHPQLVSTENGNSKQDNDKLNVGSETQESDEVLYTSKDISEDTNLEVLKTGMKVIISEKNMPMASDQTITDSKMTEINLEPVIETSSNANQKVVKEVLNIAKDITEDTNTDISNAGIEEIISEKPIPMKSDQQLSDSKITETTMEPQIETSSSNIQTIEKEESSNYLGLETKTTSTEPTIDIENINNNENTTTSQSLYIETSTQPSIEITITETKTAENADIVEVNTNIHTDHTSIEPVTEIEAESSEEHDIDTDHPQPSSLQSLDLPTNPIEVAMQNHRQLLDRLHGSVNTEDDDEFASRPDLRSNMWTSSVSETDSDYIDLNAPAQQRRLVKDDFNISTAYGHNAAAASSSSESSDTTQTATTIVSAVTRIQAGARGFLVRRRLRNSNGGTTSFAASGVGNTATAGASFGNAAIDESLEAMVEDNERITLDGAARIIQRFYRRKQARNEQAAIDIPTTPRNALLGPLVEVSQDVSNVSQDQAQDDGASTISVNISELPASSLLSPSASSSSSSSHRQQLGSDVLETLNIAANDAQNATTNQLSMDGVGSSVGGIGDHVSRRLDSEEAHQQRRMTLQRGDAVQRNSTPDEGAELAEEQVRVTVKDVEGVDTVDNVVVGMAKQPSPQPPSRPASVTTTPPPPTNANTAMRPQRPQRSRRGFRQMGMVRQNSMPVQIDSDVLRMVPKHSAKRIRSAEETESKKAAK